MWADVHWGLAVCACSEATVAASLLTLLFLSGEGLSQQEYNNSNQGFRIIATRGTDTVTDCELVFSIEEHNCAPQQSWVVKSHLLMAEWVVQIERVHVAAEMTPAIDWTQ